MNQRPTRPQPKPVEPDRFFDLFILMDDGEMVTQENISEEQAIKIRGLVGDPEGRFWVPKNETTSVVYRSKDIKKITVVLAAEEAETHE